MASASNRAWIIVGGWAAILTGALSTLRVVATVTIFQELYNPGYPPSLSSFASFWLPATLEACLVAAAVAGAWEFMRPRNRVLIAGAVAGGLSAALLFVGSLVSIAREFAGAPWWEEASCVPLGVWMLCLAAADWRLQRLPPWLRVTGAVLGAVLMVLPALPALRLATVLGLPWWIGLGAVLLRPARSTSG